MRLAKLMMAVAACSLATTPALAASSASKLSVSEASTARVGTPSGKANKQAGGFPFLIVFAVIAVGLGIYVAVDSDDEPTSP
ncbi:hypothetical protein FPZ54_16710 [Sphingomonas suaedae]|uniref:Uncharacterized protein n=1 Tax=Sphingomonas suaedae TaxID=2599297 RepID=A0A518RJ78_9SPHN|nr:hypothetical protein [Sphingomonas suaedae]QDX27481.1 hypothetical protein FPZ54_16710 [Sphingomonas suaedae]